MSASQSPPSLTLVWADPHDTDAVLPITAEPMLKASDVHHAEPLRWLHCSAGVADEIIPYCESLIRFSEVGDWRLATLTIAEIINRARRLRNSDMKMLAALAPRIALRKEIANA